MLATKRLSQSSPRPAPRRSTAPFLSTDDRGMAAGCSVSRVSRRRVIDDSGSKDLVRFCGRVIFGRRLQVRPAHAHKYRRSLPARREMHEPPVESDLAAADTEKPAEIDHQRPRPAVAID